MSDVSVAAITVIGICAVNAPEVATTATEPGATPVITPAGDTVAIDVALERHPMVAGGMLTPN